VCFCPECFASSITTEERLRVEFLGGEIICRSCSAVLHLDHSGWWLAAMIFGVEGALLALFVIVLLAAALRWWSIPVLAVLFLLVGVVVALFSPLKVVHSPTGAIPR